MKILIVEDNDVLRQNLKTFLELQSHTADTHATYEGAVYKILGGGYDAVLLDLGLGSESGDGIKICEDVRKEGGRMPIIMLTARTLVDQKIAGLHAGADDYVAKPFDYYELLARIEAVVRRDFSNKSRVISFENTGKKYEINEDQMQVMQDGQEVELSKLEFKLLLFFAKNQGKILSKETIMERVWGEVDLFKESRSVDIYVGYLRKKLGQEIIETVRGVGYTLK